MDVVRELVIDCMGRVTHECVLDYDGTVVVTVNSSGLTVRIDPHTRTVLTPGATVPASVMTLAAHLGVG